MFIDWQRVNELKSEIGPEDFGDVVELFLEEVEEELGNLGSYATASDLEAPMHFLKGSALNLGFQAFSKVCQDGETAAATGQDPPVAMAEVLAIYDRSKKEFLAALATADAA